MMSLVRKLVENKILDSALIIAAITVFSYFLTYIYESRYLQYFGAGPETARIELVPVLTTSFVVFIVSALVGVGLYKLSANLHKEHNEWKMLARAYLWLFIIIVFLFLPVVYMDDPPNFWTNIRNDIFEIFGYIASVLIIVVPVATAYYVLFYRKNLSLAKEALIKDSRAIFGTIFKIMTVIFVFILAFFYSNFFALFNAYHRTSFKEVTIDGQPVIILREYASHMVGVGYNPKENTLLDNYFYINTPDDQSLQYKVINKKINYTSDVMIKAKQEHSYQIQFGPNFFKHK